MTQNAQAFASHGLSANLSGLLSNFATALTARRVRNSERARIRRELESYSDRQLNDLGLSRIDIEDVVCGRYQR